MKSREGKLPLPFEGYVLLADLLSSMKYDDRATCAVFSWTFLVVQWNLMSRSDSVETIMLSHIDWVGDALTIEEQGQKADQTGEDKYPKHIYANPLNPSICPILALAVLVFSSCSSLDFRNHQLFNGTDSKNRFSRHLQSTMSKCSASERLQLGAYISELGTHSLRKGSGTYCLGQCGGPNPVSVSLRMGQSIGQIREKYIFTGDGADQLCGRMVCGLPFDRPEFAILPPHFTPQETANFTVEYWLSVLPCYPNFPDSFKRTIPYLYASLLYHQQYLYSNLVSNHPILSCRAFSSLSLEELKLMQAKIKCVVGICPESKLKATGIPQHLALVVRMHEMQNQLDELTNKVVEIPSQLKEVEEGIPSKVSNQVVEELRSNFIIEGVAPITRHEFNHGLAGMKDDIIAVLRQTQFEAQERSAVSPENELDNESAVPNWWKSWHWPGSQQLLHFAPPGFEFPTDLTLKEIWDLWFFGNKIIGIRPYRLLHKSDYSVKKMRHTRAAGSINFVLDVMRDRQILPAVSDINALSYAESTTYFDAAYPIVIELLYADTVDVYREGDTKYGTLYNRTLAYRHKQGLIIPKARGGGGRGRGRERGCRG